MSIFFFTKELNISSYLFHIVSVEVPQLKNCIYILYFLSQTHISSKPTHTRMYNYSVLHNTIMLQCMIPPAVDCGRQFVNANPVKRKPEWAECVSSSWYKVSETLKQDTCSSDGILTVLIWFAEIDPSCDRIQEALGTSLRSLYVLFL